MQKRRTYTQDSSQWSGGGVEDDLKLREERYDSGGQIAISGDDLQLSFFHHGGNYCGRLAKKAGLNFGICFGRGFQVWSGLIDGGADVR